MKAGNTGAAKVEHPPGTRERAFQMFRVGAKHEEIGIALNVATSTIARWSSTGKWKVRADALEAGKSTSPLSSETKRHTDTQSSDTMSLSEQQTRFRQLTAATSVRIAEAMHGMSDAELLLNAQRIKQLHDVGLKALDLEKSSPSIVVNVGLLAQATQPERLERVTSARILPAHEAITLVSDTGATPAHHADEPASDA